MRGHGRVIFGWGSDGYGWGRFSGYSVIGDSESLAVRLAPHSAPVSCSCHSVVQWCDILWKYRGVLGMFTKHGKAPERCHHLHSHRSCKKKKPPPHTPWKYLMNCPLVRKCFGIVFQFFFYFFFIFFAFGVFVNTIPSSLCWFNQFSANWRQKRF